MIRIFIPERRLLRFIKASLLIASFFLTALAARANFITVWNTANTLTGSTPNNQIRIPAVGQFRYSWQSTTNPSIEGSGVGDGSTVITFPAPGIYRVWISPSGETPFSRIVFDGSDDRSKIINIEAWGDVKWSSMEGAFMGCDKLNASALDVPDLSGVTSMRSMFRNAWIFNGDLSKWEVGTVTNMAFLFNSAFAFNSDISKWDVREVTNMGYMFWNASAFNQDLNKWEVGKVTGMIGMFQGARAFNGDVSDWDVRSVTSMERMFYWARDFNRDIGNWETGNVRGMPFMFGQTQAFNQDLGGWDVSNVMSMDGMFQDAVAFNQNLGKWDLGEIGGFPDPTIGLKEMFDGSGMDCYNYGGTLIGWAGSPGTPDGLTLGADGLFYSPAAEAARAVLIVKGWTITGDALDAGCSPLPVSLASFSAYRSEGQAILQWQTAGEVNASHFEIERSSDGRIFKTAGTVAAKQNSSVLSAYSFSDMIPGISGLVYYRLRTVDLDGAFAYSQIVALDMGNSADLPALQAYPNPAADLLRVRSAEGGNMVFYTLAGRNVGTEVIRPGLNTIDIRNLPAGMYIALMDRRVVRFVKK